MLRMFQEIMHGPEVPDLPERRDLTWIEGLALAPLVAGFVLLGVDPGLIRAQLAPSPLASTTDAHSSSRIVVTVDESACVIVNQDGSRARC